MQTPMDSLYRQIEALNNEYIALNNDFIEALNKDWPLKQRTALKERIKTVLEQIEMLEKQRANQTLFPHDNSEQA
jgi:hypothetical protein